MIKPAAMHFLIFLLALVWNARNADAQECMGSCMSDGSLAGLVFGCIFGTILLMVVAAFLLWYLKSRRDAQFEDEAKQHTYRNASLGGTKFAYDNPEFSIHPENTDESLRNGDIANIRTKKDRGTSLFSNLLGRRGSVGVDNLQSTESLQSISEVLNVPLKSQDFTGLGFNIHGNMRDGIFIKDVLSSGPAHESGKVKAGDRILSLTISFDKMVFEDALTILSYASPYHVSVELQKSSSLNLKRMGSERSSKVYMSDRKAQFHPLFKSQSIDDLALSPNAASPSANVPRDTRRARSTLDHSNSRLEAQKPVQRMKVIVEKHSSGKSSPRISPLPKGSISPEPDRSSSPNSISEESVSPKGTTIVSAEVIEPKLERPEIPHHSPRNLTDSQPSTPDQNLTPIVTPKDPYHGLSPEERMQLLRLSYEDPEVSQSTPNLYHRDVGLSVKKAPKASIVVDSQEAVYDAIPITLSSDDVTLRHQYDDVMMTSEPSEQGSVPDLSRAKAKLEAAKAMVFRERDGDSVTLGGDEYDTVPLNEEDTYDTVPSSDDTKGPVNREKLVSKTSAILRNNANGTVPVEVSSRIRNGPLSDEENFYETVPEKTLNNGDYYATVPSKNLTVINSGASTVIDSKKFNKDYQMETSAKVQPPRAPGINFESWQTTERTLPYKTRSEAVKNMEVTSWSETERTPQKLRTDEKEYFLDRSSVKQTDSTAALQLNRHLTDKTNGIYHHNGQTAHHTSAVGTSSVPLGGDQSALRIELPANQLRPDEQTDQSSYADVDKEQYQKLLYFQQQLARQHEELTSMGIAIPMNLSGFKTQPGLNGNKVANGGVEPAIH